MIHFQKWRLILLLAMVSICMGMAGQPGGDHSTFGESEFGQTSPPAGQNSTAAAQRAKELVIENDSELPVAYPHGPYELQFKAHGGVSALHWRLLNGALPPGMKLEQSGLLHGQPQRAGEFQFTVAVNENGNEQTAVQKGFVLRVVSALSLNWKTPARVDGQRIEGSVVVSNTTPDDIDLTFVAMAIAANGRATAIGYQHFVLKRGTTEMELPFGENLPSGGYVIHIDAVGEVATKNLIYREQLQTPSALQVMVGP
jgi:hypothetical protein